MSSTSIVHLFGVYACLVAYFMGDCDTLVCAQTEAQGNLTPYHAGLKIVDFKYINSDGEREVITSAIWYPTQESPDRYTYHLSKDYESSVALNAPHIARGGPYPLVLYAHGGFSCGYGAAYFSEYLAKHGYIVVGPDFVDTKPPDYTEPLAFATIKQGKISRPLAVLKLAKQWLEDMNADRVFFLSYLEKHRFNHVSHIIDKMLKLNQNPDSIFYQTIRTDAIGMFGHSEGGITLLGKIGAHPDPKFKDTRIRAGLVFSASPYPFEKTLQHIDIPMMLMIGDHDKPGVGTNLTRRMIYDEVHAPKYYLVLKDANHFAFGNSSSPLDQSTKNDPKASAICRYGLAFFDSYLLKDPKAKGELGQSDPAWAYYVKESAPGKVVEWGQEPPPPSSEERFGGLGYQQEGGREGRGRLLQRILERRRNR